MSAISTIGERRLGQTGRGTDPLRPGRTRTGVAEGRSGRGRTPTALPRPTISAAAGRLFSAAADHQHDQLPTFAPLLEEVELDGWSSQQRVFAGNFHDWMLLEERRVLVMVGQAIGPEPCDPIETALVAQAAWTALRAHAYYTDDAGALLMHAARTLWTNPTMSQQASVAVAILDAVGGSTSLAIAGECLVWRARAATWDRLPCDQPPLGAETNFAYAAHDFAMSLRERLLLVADHPAYRPRKFATAIADSFTHLDAESHRRMTATDALGIVRRRYERETADDVLASASIVAVRRR